MNYLDHIILVLSCFADFFIAYSFYKGFFDLKENLNNKKAVCICICAALILYGINLIGIAMLNLIASSIMLILTFNYLFKGRLSAKIMYYIIMMTVMLGSEVICAVLYEQSSQGSSINLSDVPFQTFMSKLVAFIILLILRHCVGKKQRMVNRVFFTFLLLPATSVGMMCTTFYMSEDVLYTPGIKLTLTILFALVVFGNLIVFSAFNSYSEELNKSMHNELIIAKEKANRKYYEKITEVNEERRMLIHDVKHYLSGLRGLINSDKKEEALELINRLNGNLDENELTIYTSVPIIDAMLTEKKAIADKNNVELEISINKSVIFDKIPQIEYMVMMSNLLDNAIGAASGCEYSKNVTVEIYEKNNNSFLINKISNDYDKKKVKIADGDFVTTKEEKGFHGLGLKSVRQMAKRYNGMLYTEMKDQKFIVSLVFQQNE